MKNVVVFGAGMAGLSVAYELSKNNVKVDLLEKDSQVGGLAKSFTKDGFTVDLGPHAFLIKDKEMLDTIKKLLKDNKLIHNTRKSRIYVEGKYFDWPLKIFNTILTLSPLVSMKIFFEYLAIKTKKNKIDDSFESYTINRFGKSLYEIFLKDYNTKLLGLSPNNISIDWAKQRIGLNGIADIIKQALFKNKNQTRTNKRKFYFPEQGGIGSIPLKFLEAIKNKDCKVYLNSFPIKIKKNMITFSNKKQEITKKYDAVISTIPLTESIKLLDDVPEDIKKSASNLKFRSTIFVYLVLKKEKFGKDHWIYFPHSEGEIFFNRLTEFKNFSEKTCPKDKTIVCAEITCNFEGKTWNLDEKTLIKNVKDKLIDLDFIKEAEVLDNFIRKEKYAYVVYDTNYSNNKDKVLRFLEENGIYSIGRFASFCHKNMAYSIDLGFKLARSLLLK
ncbi:hypothetical protein CL621_03165 [archaeon]|nr:hypothetical protein [archaeon]|tara:strand:- start:1036 stop:2367 length:1332 start_codon:yes stop_codon:yes gene_type:complete